MNVAIAGTEFPRTHYDSRGDVLYLNSEAWQGRSTNPLVSDEGHGVELDESGRLIAMTIVGARWWLERDGELRITLPAEQLTPRELAALGGSCALRVSEAELAPALKSAA
ncbi:MAG TPA: DUF2283 domain-containing protein [Conexibacter sp.]|nr:DUF2283 domain-containing protein [Conexibacter sp.]